MMGVSVTGIAVVLTLVGWLTTGERVIVAEIAGCELVGTICEFVGRSVGLVSGSAATDVGAVSLVAAILVT